MMFELKNNRIKVSVRNMVEFLLRNGSITSGKGTLSTEKTMEAGSRIHKKIQKSMPVSYQAEVPLKHLIKKSNYDILLEGRADGIDVRGEEVLIDEIKGTYKNLDHMDEPDLLHQAQAFCYGYMYLYEHPALTQIEVQITYCHMDTEEIKRFRKTYDRTYLENWFHEQMDSFSLFTDLVYQFKKEYQSSVKELAFPFAYRKGQKDMTAAVYYAIREKKNLFVQAPTGVGKTMSTIYPAVKALGEEKATRIFYLTAKNITATVAEESIETLYEKGLKMRYVTITAKDKLCVCEKRDCNPSTCERANGHYDRINEALYALISSEHIINQKIILDYAARYQVCPYELCLDASLFAEIVICDYNYAFDPTVRLKRYFQGGKGDYIFLVDETHNLVERSREMYSASLSKSDFLKCRKLMKEIDRKVYQKLSDANKKMLDLKRQCEGFTVLESVESLYFSLTRLKTELDRFFEESDSFEEKDELLDLYFAVNQFLVTYENIDDCYKIYGEETTDEFIIKLFCIQPCNNLAFCLESSVSTIFFSATILPVEYYKQVLCGNKEELAIYIPSPFQETNRLLMIGNDVSTLYKRRGYPEYYKIYLHMIHVITAKKGNYMVFFPSYQVMDEVTNLLYEEGYPSDYELLIQDSSMSEQDKASFLSRFEEGPVLGCCVLGGMFSEGIDLTGDRLIGTIIVGTGLPKVTKERDLLRLYYDENGEDGFLYAYLYPGMNKVMQAAGRVIRTEQDRGSILLLDERFMRPNYQELFPREWNHFRITNRYNVKKTIEEFWEEKENEI